MAWITSSDLVAAVSSAGGLGVLGTSADFTEIVKGIPENVEEMHKTIRRTRTLTDKPFGINVFPAAADPYGFSKAMIALAKEEGVNILVVAGNVSPDEIKQWKKALLSRNFSEQRKLRIHNGFRHLGNEIIVENFV